MVLATQNPREYHGTFPLPESQLDRFLMRISIGYPDAESEREILVSTRFERGARRGAVRRRGLRRSGRRRERASGSGARRLHSRHRRRHAAVGGRRARRQPTCRQGSLSGGAVGSARRGQRLRAARSHQGAGGARCSPTGCSFGARKPPTSIGKRACSPRFSRTCGCRCEGCAVSAANTRRAATPARQRRRVLDRVDLSAPEPSAHPRGMVLSRGDDRDRPGGAEHRPQSLLSRLRHARVADRRFGPAVGARGAASARRAAGSGGDVRAQRRPLELRVRNVSRKRASYAVEIREGVAGQPRRRVGFLDRLDPGVERSFVSLWSFPRRGRQSFRSVHLVTRFPFGLFEKTRIVPAGESCVVFPAVEGEGRRRLSCEAGRPMRSASIGWARRSSAFGASSPTTIPAGSTGGSRLGSASGWSPSTPSARPSRSPCSSTAADRRAKGSRRPWSARRPSSGARAATGAAFAFFLGPIVPRRGPGRRFARRLTFLAEVQPPRPTPAEPAIASSAIGGEKSSATERASSSRQGSRRTFRPERSSAWPDAT